MERLPETLKRSRKFVLNADMKNKTRKCIPQVIEKSEIKLSKAKSALQKSSQKRKVVAS